MSSVSIPESSKGSIMAPFLRKLKGKRSKGAMDSEVNGKMAAAKIKGWTLPASRCMLSQRDGGRTELFGAAGTEGSFHQQLHGC